MTISQGRPSLWALFTSLTKFRIASANIITGLAGYLIFPTVIEPLSLVLALAGIYLLASGVAALNEVQEARFDAQMERTASRPIPQGHISRSFGLGVSVSLMSLALLLLMLASGGSWLVAALAFAVIIAYNGIYTPLKRRIVLAAVPGALIGSLAPAIGWAVAYATSDYDMSFISAYRIDLLIRLSFVQLLFFAAFLFVWQIPHFWLLLLVYDKEYRNAGYPVLTDVLPDRGMRHMIFYWLVGTVLFGLIPVLVFDHVLLYSGSGSLWLYMLVPTLIGGVAIFSATRLFGSRMQDVEKLALRRAQLRYVFMQLNIFVLVVVAFHIGLSLIEQAHGGVNS